MLRSGTVSRHIYAVLNGDCSKLSSAYGCKTSNEEAKDEYVAGIVLPEPKVERVSGIWDAFLK